MKALITGIAGQDGSYLAEHLLSLGYEVHGIVRRAALESPSEHLKRIQHIRKDLKLHPASLESFPSILDIFKNVKPDECYHLAAQSFVTYALDDDFSTMSANINSTHYVLSSIKNTCPDCRFYFAGSSEMFGNVGITPQNEETEFRPRSVYGISKVAGFDLTRSYREAYSIFACTGIMFNHESPRRGLEFVTRKISSGVAKIKMGLEKELRLGNLDAERDWGYAKDYVRAMHMMLTQNEPGDFVIGTNETHTVRDFAKRAFEVVGLNYKDYVVVDPVFYRPVEVSRLVSDSLKAKEKLGWTCTVKFEELVELMVTEEHELLRTRFV